MRPGGRARAVRDFVVRDAEGEVGASRSPSSYADLVRLTERGRRVHAGRGEQVIVADAPDDAPLRLRFARRGGILGPLLAERHLRDAGVLRELAIWEHLACANVPTPAVRFAAAWREGGFRRGVLATVDLPDSVDARALLSHDEFIPIRVEAARAAGRTLRTLHDAGVIHGDLHLGNLLFEPVAGPSGQGRAAGGWRCLLVDFDRARRRDALALADRLSDFLRLARSVEKHGLAARLDEPVVDAAIEAYCDRDPALRQAIERRWPRVQYRLWRHRLAWTLERRLPFARAREVPAERRSIS